MIERRLGSNPTTATRFMTFHRLLRVRANQVELSLMKKQNNLTPRPIMKMKTADKKETKSK